MHTITKAEIEDAAARVELATRARAHTAVVCGKRTQEDSSRELRFWTTAIDKAERQLKMSAIDSANVTKWWPTEDPRTFGFASSSANKPYEASLDTCECEAFKHGNPCWHRAGVAVLIDIDKHRRVTSRAPAWEIRRRLSAAELEAAAQELFG